MIPALLISALLVAGLSTASADPHDPVADLSTFCQNGDSTSCLMLAVRARQAAAFYRQGCEMGDPLACMQLASSFEPNRGLKLRQQVLGLQEAGCMNGVSELCGTVGLAYVDRRSVALHDPARGMQLLTAACGGGDINACSLAEALDPKEVRIGKERIEVDGKVAAIVEERSGRWLLRSEDVEDGQVVALKRALEASSGWLRQTAQAAGGSTAGISGQVRLVTLEDIPFAVLEPVLRTLESAGFRDVRLVVNRADGEQVADFSLPLGLALRSAPASDADAVEREAIRATMEGHAKAFRRCYELRLLHDPTLAGRLLIDFTIQPNGRVTELHTGVNTLSDPEVARCVEAQIAELSFPLPHDQQPLPVSYPFTFMP